jgi:hypothetical protein
MLEMSEIGSNPKVSVVIPTYNYKNVIIFNDAEI